MTRPDSHKERAIAIAKENGFDPDARIERPGAKPIPAWVQYLDAAKAEAQAAKDAAERGSSYISPQSDQYTNSPLTIFGNHEQNTISQMEECMKVGNVVGGVLCADGHLGYAQPVGGVIAYENQISISGVGFDIGCFTGDTRIYCLDNTTPTFEEIVDKDVYVLSYTSEGVPVPALAKGIKTSKNAELFEVIIDNNQVIRCTPDHLFMMRDGTYKRADKLLSGDSLMPSYVIQDKDGYVLVRNSKTRNLIRMHYLVYRTGLTEKCPELNGDELVIHHKNFVRWDNNPNNLQPMGKIEHDEYHASMRTKAHFNTPDFTKNRLLSLQKFWEKARTNKEFMGKRAATATKNITNYMTNNREQFLEDIKDNGKRGAEYLKKYNTDPQKMLERKTKVMAPVECPLCGEICKGLSSLFYHAKKNHPKELINGERKGCSKSGKNSVMERLLLGANNHKVLSVRKLAEKEDVYCLIVPGLNNFALACGVVVHNCGNLAVKLDTPFSAVKDHIGPILNDITRVVSFGVGRTNNTRVEHKLFDNTDAWLKSDMEYYRQKAESQLGTVGSGNHYVDLLRDENDHVWIGVHFGSRGLGHTSATRYLKAAGGKDGINVPPTVVDEDSEIGQRYIAAMELAGQYSYAGREWVVEQVRQIIGGKVLDSIHNHHNYAWRENHNDKDLWVVRKGATPAFPGQRGFVGGSMGDDAVILEGVDSQEARDSLYSTVHGAGRNFGRAAAKRTFTREQMDEWLRNKGVTVSGGDLDESPMAYKRLPDVLAHHSNSVRVLHTLRPFAVAMAGTGEFDPFKD